MMRANWGALDWGILMLNNDEHSTISDFILQFGVFFMKWEERVWVATMALFLPAWGVLMHVEQHTEGKMSV